MYWHYVALLTVERLWENMPLLESKLKGVWAYFIDWKYYNLTEKSLFRRWKIIDFFCRKIFRSIKFNYYQLFIMINQYDNLNFFEIYRLGLLLADKKIIILNDGYHIQVMVWNYLLFFSVNKSPKFFPLSFALKMRKHKNSINLKKKCVR